MGFKQLIAGALIGLVSCGTFATTEWEHLGVADNGFAMSVDKNSISQVSQYGYEQYYKVWIRNIVYNDLIEDGFGIGDYVMILYWVNCRDKMLGTKSIATYKKQKNGGTNPETNSVSNVKMFDVIPNSSGDKILNIVCSS